MSKKYKIRISTSTRKILNEYKGSMYRRPIADMFHSNYEDNRPDWLKASESWSVELRPHLTDVFLDDDQVAQIIDLATTHGIVLKYGVSYLLGTFLHAALRGYLVSKGEYKSTHKIDTSPPKPRAKQTNFAIGFLDFEKAEEIRELYIQGWKQKDIATKFSVSRSLISHIVNYKIWRPNENV